MSSASAESRLFLWLLPTERPARLPPARLPEPSEYGRSDFLERTRLGSRVSPPTTYSTKLALRMDELGSSGDRKRSLRERREPLFFEPLSELFIVFSGLLLRSVVMLTLMSFERSKPERSCAAPWPAGWVRSVCGSCVLFKKLPFAPPF